MVDRNGIEPFLQACKARVPPTTPTAHINLVSLAGFEPAPHAPKAWTLPDYAIER